MNQDMLIVFFSTRELAEEYKDSMTLDEENNYGQRYEIDEMEVLNEL